MYDQDYPDPNRPDQSAPTETGQGPLPSPSSGAVATWPRPSSPAGPGASPRERSTTSRWWLIVDFFSSIHVVVLGFLIATVRLLANSVYMQGTHRPEPRQAHRGHSAGVGHRDRPLDLLLRLPRYRPVLRPPAGPWPRLDRLHRLYPAAVAARAQDLGRLDRQDRRPRPHLGLRLRDQSSSA